MKKIFKTIGLICMAVVVAVGSIFVTKKQTQNEINVASAVNDYVDLDYSFTGSNLFYITLCRFNFSNLSSSDTVSFSTEIKSFSDGSYSIKPSFSYIICSSLDVVVYGSRIYNFEDNSYYGLSSETFIDFTDYVSLKFYPDYDNSSAYTPCFVTINNINSQFTANIYKVVISNSDVDYSSNLTSYYIDYYDIDDNYIRFEFYQHSSVPVFEPRIYYFKNLELTDNQYYNSGYQQGLADNQKTIYNQGYSSGHNVGYYDGYSAGIKDSNSYTFTGLIGAVVDVPVKTLLGLFDFEILGVNLFKFSVSLITFSVVLFIIRKIKGGR